jgi:hypothetical protein
MTEEQVGGAGTRGSCDGEHGSIALTAVLRLGGGGNVPVLKAMG